MNTRKHIIGLVITVMALSSLVVVDNTAAKEGSTPSPAAMSLSPTHTPEPQVTQSHLEATITPSNNYGRNHEPDDAEPTGLRVSDAIATPLAPRPAATASPANTAPLEATFGAGAAEQAEVLQNAAQEAAPNLQAVAGVRTYSWHQDMEGPVRMLPSRSAICYLTEMGGRFRGAGERVTIANRDGYWWLGGESKQEGVTADATCVPFSAIRHSHTLRYSVKPAFVWARANSCPPILPCDPLGYGQVPLGSPSDFCYLTGMGGHFRGGGEWVSIFNRNGTLVLAVNTQVDGGYIRAEAGCISLVGNSNQRVSASRTWKRGDRPVSLLGIDTAFCSLTGMQGRYQSTRDRVEVFTAGQNQFLFGATDSDKANLARARCYYYDQRPRVPPPTPAPAPPRLFHVHLPIVRR